MSLIPALKIGFWNAWIFMSVFLLQMLFIMIVDRSIGERSHIPIEARINKLEQYTGRIGNVMWLLALGYSVFLPLQLGTFWFHISIPVFIIGFILMVKATYDFITTPKDQLIIKGAYKISRHPMYLATVIICLSSGIATASWLFILISTIMALCLFKESIIEERYCLKKYKNIYRQYMDRTPGFIGFPRTKIIK